MKSANFENYRVYGRDNTSYITINTFSPKSSHIVIVIYCNTLKYNAQCSIDPYCFTPTVYRLSKNWTLMKRSLRFVTDLSTLLKALKMEKYEEIFQKEEIDLDLFLTMSEEEFGEIGITTLGARRRLSNAIKGVLQFCYY